MISGFNPYTLAPFGDDGEEEEEENVNEESRGRFDEIYLLLDLRNIFCIAYDLFEGVQYFVQR